jgi:hypothetical protein
MSYLNALMDKGIRPVVGVDESFGNNMNDKTTDHYVAIIGRRINVSNGTVSYRFLDPGTSRGNKNYFVFKIDSNGMYRSEPTWDDAEYERYIITHVVETK